MGKLVRNRIPEIIAREGRSVTYRILEGEEYRQALIKKLAEEYKELINALAEGEEDEIMGECCDLSQVLTDLSYSIIKRSTALDTEVVNKMAKVGSFSDGIYLEGWGD